MFLLKTDLVTDSTASSIRCAETSGNCSIDYDEVNNNNNNNNNNYNSNNFF